jgi:aminodeoxyfutalosine synthase
MGVANLADAFFLRINRESFVMPPANDPFSTDSMCPPPPMELFGQKSPRLGFDEGLRLWREASLRDLGRWATQSRLRRFGRRIVYSIGGHINYSNICALKCSFCAFGKSKDADAAQAFQLSPTAFVEQADVLAARGVAEFHVVGGIHPDLPFDYHLSLVRALREKHTKIGRKCFSATEVAHFARQSALPISEILSRLQNAGDAVLTGGGAEILDDSLRQKICPQKESADRWLAIHREAHRLGLPSNATMLFGHLETPEQIIAHLLRLRDLQDETAGFLAFVPLPYRPTAMPTALSRGPSAALILRVFAVSRLLLDNFPHIKAYRPALAPLPVEIALLFGASDLDAIAYSEKVCRAADNEMAAQHRPNDFSITEPADLVAAVNAEPVERDVLYRRIERHPPELTAWKVHSAVSLLGDGFHPFHPRKDNA